MSFVILLCFISPVYGANLPGAGGSVQSGYQIAGLSLSNFPPGVSLPVVRGDSDSDVARITPSSQEVRENDAQGVIPPVVRIAPVSDINPVHTVSAESNASVESDIYMIPSSARNTGSTSIFFGGLDDIAREYSIGTICIKPIGGTGWGPCSSYAIGYHTWRFDFSGCTPGAYEAIIPYYDRFYAYEKRIGGFTVIDSTLPTPTPTPSILTITSITPSTSQNTGSVMITDLSGAQFTSGAKVSLTRTGSPNIDGIYVDVISSSKISCQFPITGATPGAWNVVVTNPDGQTATLAGGFTITPGITPTPTVTPSPSSPTITKISPSSGYNSNNLTATITGNNFKVKAVVKLTKGSVTKIVPIKNIVSTQISCILPLSGIDAGVYSLMVRNPDGKSATKKNAVTVLPVGKKPTISNIKPYVGSIKTNTTVTITGTNFRAKAVVQIIKGSTTKKATMKNSTAKKIVCTLPTKGAETGKWNLMITNADGTTVAKPGIFTVKRTVSSNEVEAGQVSGIVLTMPISSDSSGIPSRGSTLSYGSLVPITAPILSPGVPAF